MYFGNKEKTSELISKLSTDHNWMIEFGWHKKYKKSLKRVCSKNKKITKSLKFCSSEILDAFQQNIVFGVHALFLLEWYYLRVPGKVWSGGGGGGYSPEG